MSGSKEMEFTEQFTSGGDVSGEIGGEIEGEIFIPMDSGEMDDGTLDEPVFTTIVSGYSKRLSTCTKTCLFLRNVI